MTEDIYRDGILFVAYDGCPEGGFSDKASAKEAMAKLQAEGWCVRVLLHHGKWMVYYGKRVTSSE